MSKQSQNLTAIALGSAMTFAGISHLTFNREEFQAQVPNWFPMDKDAAVSYTHLTLPTKA